MGASILLAGRLMEGLEHECVGRANFIGFSEDENGSPQAHVTEIKWFEKSFACPTDFKSGVFAEIDADSFDTLQADTILPAGLAEAGPVFLGEDLYATIAQHVTARQHGVCCFLGTPLKPGDGAPTPIRPPDSGGVVHVRNFLYLENEIARLFTVFAWTAGPEHEIIVDASRVRAGVLAAMSRDGHLVLTGDPDWWPDPDALAWHRKEFFDQIENRI